MLMHAWNLVAPPSASFISLVHRVIALALYKGLHAAEARPVQMGGCRAGPDSHALWVELAKMLDIPLVLQLNAISILLTDCARCGDLYYPVGAFPLWRSASTCLHPWPTERT